MNTKLEDFEIILKFYLFEEGNLIMINEKCPRLMKNVRSIQSTFEIKEHKCIQHSDTCRV
jgi:hypothetical protein